VELIATPTAMDTTLPDHEDEPLPLRHLTPRTLLGGGGPERETIGHLFASQIASFIATKDPNEMRPVVVGLGFEKWNVNREAFFDLMALVQYVLK
jgi:proteasome assembly chaperone 3